MSTSGKTVHKLWRLCKTIVYNLKMDKKSMDNFIKTMKSVDYLVRSKNMSKVKMAAFDLDGTVIEEGIFMSENTKKMFKRLNDSNIEMVIATGRPYYSAKLIAENIGIDAAIIATNGTYLKPLDGGAILKSFRREEWTEMIDYFHKLGYYFQVMCEDNVYYYKRDTWGEMLRVQMKSLEDQELKTMISTSLERSIVLDSIEEFFVIEEKVLKIRLEVPNLSHRDDIIEKFKGLYSFGFQDESLDDENSIRKDSPKALEITPLNASKGTTLTEYANSLGIDMSEVFAIGDNGNDFDMIEMAGIGVAMGNAVKDLKEIANCVTDDVKDDGALKAVEKFIFSEVDNV